MSILNARIRRTSPLPARVVLTAVGLLVLAPVQPPVAAQVAAAPAVTFDAAMFKRNKEVENQRASVNPNIPQIPGRAQTLRGGNLVGRGMTVRHRSDGRLGPNLTPSKGGCRSFFQREPVNVGFIEAARKEGEPEPLRACGTAVGLGIIIAENMPMTDWVKILSLRPQLNRTVIDRTGLAGNFDIRLQDTEPSEPATYLPPPIKPMLESQLGLTLRDAEGAVEILVIENVEHPTEN
jgi:hypothetical protein